MPSRHSSRSPPAPSPRRPRRLPRLRRAARRWRWTRAGRWRSTRPDRPRRRKERRPLGGSGLSAAPTRSAAPARATLSARPPRGSILGARRRLGARRCTLCAPRRACSARVTPCALKITSAPRRGGRRRGRRRRPQRRRAGAAGLKCGRMWRCTRRTWRESPASGSASARANAFIATGRRARASAVNTLQILRHCGRRGG
mmetsp:Transcript_36483/g.111856  ORF Transcript_36483/g.111856 Transcript_36483/m.111856 type:complete len:200 (-) Transcript_36483:447-1046(-)